MAIMDLSDKNIFCKEAKITSDMLFKSEPFPSLSTLKKGIVLELLNIKKSHGISWPEYKGWIEAILNPNPLILLNTLRKSVLDVVTRKDKLTRNVHRIGRSKLDDFLHEEYKLPKQRPSITTKTSIPKSSPLKPTCNQIIAASVNRSLAAEIAELKQKVATDEQQLIVKEKKIQKVNSNFRNVNKKLKRKDNKISTLLSTITSLKHGRAAPIKNKHTKSLSNLVRYYRAKCSNLSNKLQTFECSDCNELDITVNNLKQENRELREKNAELIDKVKESKRVSFFSERKYSDNLRLCIMELLTYNVGVLKIEPVLRSVFKLLNIECDLLPQHTTINEILIESRSLAHTQIAEVLTKTFENTLHSDGTTKFGHKYQSYQVTTQDGALTLGLQVSRLYGSRPHKDFIIYYLLGGYIR